MRAPGPLRNVRIVRVALATALVLLVPLLAMRVTGEVAWSPADFVVAGALLLGVGLAYEILASMTGRSAYRVAAGAALATALVLVWSNLAVGLIGSEDEAANAMYVVVLAAAIGGAVVARLRPRGMARALLAAASAQALVALIALAAGMHRYPGASVAEIVGVNAFFVALWVGSALLFRRAARERGGSAPEPAAH